MFVTMRAVWLMTAGVIAVLALPRPATVLIWAAICALAVLLDTVAAPHPRKTVVERQLTRAIRLGETTACQLTITNPTGRTMRLRVRDAWPPSAGASHNVTDLLIPAGQRRRSSTQLTPTRRGDRIADAVTIRSTGPLGLAGRQSSLAAPARLRVLPPFHSRRHLPSRLARLREMDGRSAVMVRGAGTEFDSLREYVIGDDVRAIDWQSTARRGEVVVRTWRPERDRRVLIVLDTGRLSAVRVGGFPRIDAEIEAALLLSAVASKAGDRVDVVALDERVRAEIRGETGPTLMPALADGLAPIDPSLTETNWKLVSDVAQRCLNQRSLIVLLSAFDGAGTDAIRLRALGAMSGKHTVVIASATDPSLQELRRRRATTRDAYMAAAAERDELEHTSTRALLQRHGINVVEAPATALAPALVDTYLGLKAAGRL